jgi:probable addiction module antidote protein
MASKRPKRQQYSRFEASDYLKNEAEAVAYLKACMDEAGDDASLITAALGDIARAYGMSRLAKEIGMSRVGLHKALDKNGNPSFGTVLKVAYALGFKFVPKAA